MSSKHKPVKPVLTPTAEPDLYVLYRNHPSLASEIARLRKVKIPTAGPAAPLAQQEELFSVAPGLTRKAWRLKLKNDAAR
jgi:hypothetical protein